MSIEFTTWTPAEKVNPYAEAVETVAKSDNPNAAFTITVDTSKSATERAKVSKAANAIGKTAQLRQTVENPAKGKNPATVSMTFTLTKKHKARRGAK